MARKRERERERDVCNSSIIKTSCTFLNIVSFFNKLYQKNSSTFLFSDAESNNFVEQEPTNLRNSETLTAVPTDTDTEFTPIPLHPEESKNPTCQPTKQGYLTSILSSLPNLSLSSITGDGSGTVQGAESVQNTKAPLHDRRDSLRDTSPPVIANFHDSRRANFTGFAEVNPGSGGSLQLPAPPQSTVPPTLPSTTNGKLFRSVNEKINRL